MGPSDGGLCRQVVLLERCIIVAHGAAYSGHYRQVFGTQLNIKYIENILGPQAVSFERGCPYFIASTIEDSL